MTERERQDFVRALRMSGLANPKKWDILNQAADEIEQLAKELEEVKRYDMRDWNNALERGRKQMGTI